MHQVSITTEDEYSHWAENFGEGRTLFFTDRLKAASVC